MMLKVREDLGGLFIYVLNTRGKKTGTIKAEGSPSTFLTSLTRQRRTSSKTSYGQLAERGWMTKTRKMLEKKV